MNPRENSGFTLIELMIVVAIIGVLAATALPRFQTFQLRSKAGEGRLNLVAIRSAEGAYFGEYGTYIHVLPEPSTSGPSGNPPGTNKRPWGACPAAMTMLSPGACLIGFSPEGPTYYDYGVNTNTGGNALGPAVTNTEYFADASSDIDGDGTNNLWGLQVAAGGAAPTVGAGVNGCPQVLDNNGAPGLLGQVGPCGVGFGQTVF